MDRSVVRPGHVGECDSSALSPAVPINLPWVPFERTDIQTADGGALREFARIRLRARRSFVAHVDPTRDVSLVPSREAAAFPNGDQRLRKS